MRHRFNAQDAQQAQDAKTEDDQPKVVIDRTAVARIQAESEEELGHLSRGTLGWLEGDGYREAVVRTHHHDDTLPEFAAVLTMQRRPNPKGA